MEYPQNDAQAPCNAALYYVKYLSAVRRERHTSMTKAAIAGGALAIVLVVLLALVAGHRAPKQTLKQEEEPAAATAPPATLATEEAAPEAHQGFIFGRVTGRYE